MKACKEPNCGIGALMKMTVCATCRTELEEVGGDYYHRAKHVKDHKPAPIARTLLVERYPSFDMEISAAA